MTKFQKKKCLEAAEQKTSKLLVVVCCCKTVENRLLDTLQNLHLLLRNLAVCHQPMPPLYFRPVTLMKIIAYRSGIWQRVFRMFVRKNVDKHMFVLYYNIRTDVRIA